jgi:hypothetical protein
VADIDVASPGYAIDITSAEFRFDGDRLSAAVESLDYNMKTDEEIVHLQGLQDPQERTAGQRMYDGNITWATRQWLRFADLNGGLDEVTNKVFTLTVIASPKNDPAVYEFTFYDFRMHSDGGNIDKSASKTKVACSFFRRTMVPVTDA